jgi:hypothetical protein
LTHSLESEIIDIINEVNFQDSRISSLEQSIPAKNSLDTTRAIYASCINEDGLAPLEAFAWICFIFGAAMVLWGIWSLTHSQIG